MTASWRSPRLSSSAGELDASQNTTGENATTKFHCSICFRGIERPEASGCPLSPPPAKKRRHKKSKRKKRTTLEKAKTKRMTFGSNRLPRIVAHPPEGRSAERVKSLYARLPGTHTYTIGERKYSSRNQGVMCKHTHEINSEHVDTADFQSMKDYTSSISFHENSKIDFSHTKTPAPLPSLPYFGTEGGP